MAYQFNPREHVPAAIRRIVREEIQFAVRQLNGQGEANRDTAIHEARKSMKKIRGAIRMMRPELEPIYPAENAFFRDIGRKLSEYRDAAAMLETFDALRKKYDSGAGKPHMAGMRRALTARRKQHADIDQVLKPLAASLRGSTPRLKDWPLGADGFEALEPGLAATFKKARKALKRARQDPSPENYHQWRKRVKDHWYHVRLLEPFWDGGAADYEKKLKELETWLGEDHNVVVLEETVLAEPALHADPVEVELFFKLAAKYHKELRSDALSSGKDIFGETPRRMTKQMRRLWEAGHAKRPRARRRAEANPAPKREGG